MVEWLARTKRAWLVLTPERRKRAGGFGWLESSVIERIAPLYVCFSSLAFNAISLAHFPSRPSSKHISPLSILSLYSCAYSFPGLCFFLLTHFRIFYKSRNVIQKGLSTASPAIWSLFKILFQSTKLPAPTLS